MAARTDIRQRAPDAAAAGGVAGRLRLPFRRHLGQAGAIAYDYLRERRGLLTSVWTTLEAGTAVFLVLWPVAKLRYVLRWATRGEVCRSGT